MVPSKTKLRPLTQAVCPTTCSGLQPTCLQSLEGQGSLLLGDCSGLITTWQITRSNSGDSAVRPQLLLSGHDAGVSLLATAFPGNTGQPLVVSISSDSMACAWEAAGARCLRRAHLSVAPTRGWVLLPDGHHLCFSCRPREHLLKQPLTPPAAAGAGGAGARGAGAGSTAATRGGLGGATAGGGAGDGVHAAPASQRLLAVLEPLSLSLKGLLRPVSMQELGLEAGAHHSNGLGNLALRILALPTKTVALGVSVDGHLVVWDFSTMANVADGQPLTPPTSPPTSPRAAQRTGSRLGEGLLGLSLPGMLVGASFSEDASLLLLVCCGGWALLQAAGWDGQDVPVYSRLLHLAVGSEGQGQGGEAELAGGVILSGAMAADRTRVDHYYAGTAGGGGAVETLVLWHADGGMAFLHVACGADPPLLQPVAHVPPAASGGGGSVCGQVHVAFLGSSQVARLCCFGGSAECDPPSSLPAQQASAGNGAAAAGGAQLMVFQLPYLFPALARDGSRGGFPLVQKPEAQAASLADWGADSVVPGCGGSSFGTGVASGGSSGFGSAEAAGGCGGSCNAAGASGGGASCFDTMVIPGDDSGSSVEAGGAYGLGRSGAEAAGGNGLGSRTPEPTVTVAALAGSNSHAAEYVAQGMSDGSIQLWPLVAYAVPHLGSRGPCVQLRGHRGMVTCLLEVPDSHRVGGKGDSSGSGKLLLSAAGDGSICAWDVGSHPPGQRLFSLHVHTDKVLQLVLAPPGHSPPWGPCLASIGADGVVALLSLATGSCERLLHAPPRCLPHTLAWDLGRGYLAAMCALRGPAADWGWGAAPAAAAAEDEEGQGMRAVPVFVLWDVHAGSQDRVVAGEHAAAAMQTFLNGISLHHAPQQQPRSFSPHQLPASPPAPLSPTAPPAAVAAGPAPRRTSTEDSDSPSPFAPSKPFVTASSVPHFAREEGEGGGGSPCLLAQGVLLLDIDVHGLLHSREPLAGLAPPRSCASAAQLSRPAGAARQQEWLPAIGALDLRSSSSRASLDQQRSDSACSSRAPSATVSPAGPATLSSSGVTAAEQLGPGGASPQGPGAAQPCAAGPWSGGQLAQGGVRTEMAVSSAGTGLGGQLTSRAAQLQLQQQQQQQPAGHMQVQPQALPGSGSPPLPPATPQAPAALPAAAAAQQSLQPAAVRARPPSPHHISLGSPPIPLSPGMDPSALSPLGSPRPCPPFPTAVAPASLDAALLLSLALLHCWGLDGEVDAAMLRMLGRCGYPVAVPGTGGGGQHAQHALDLVQPVWRDHDCFVMECPMRVAAPGATAEHSMGSGGAGGGEGGQAGEQAGGQGAAGAPARPPRPLAFFPGGSGVAALEGSGLGTAPSWDGNTHGVQVLERESSTAAEPGIMSGGRGHELWTRDGLFVAERLLSIVALSRKLMGRHTLEEDIVVPCSALISFYTLRLPELLPSMATPDVGHYVEHWQDSNDCIREAARGLLAAATDPSLVPPGHLPPQLKAFEALWEGPGAGPSPAQLAEHSTDLLCCAAACLFHDKLVPERLVSLTVPCLAGLVLHAPSPLAAAAASMLAEGLASPGAGHHWRHFLGDLHGFLTRLYQLADKLAAMSAELSHAHSPHHATSKHRQGGLPGPAPSPGARIRPHSPASPHASGAGGGAGGAGGDAAPGGGSVMACRDAVGALLSSMASLDLPLFLEVLGQRLVGDVPPASPTHLLSFTALIRLMHSGRGQQRMAAHLPEVVAVAMRALDPARSALKRTCLGGVMALVKELCMRFPQVAYHADSMQLAVAEPEVRGRANLVEAASTGSLSSSSSHGGGGPAGAAAAAAAGGRPASAWGQQQGEAVAVYDLDTGHKTFQLRIDLPGHQRAGSAEGGALVAICFSPHGDYLMGYSDEDGVALGWRLQRGWTQRLAARGPTPLGPAKCVVVPASAALRSMHQTPAGHVSLGYSLKLETPGRLRLAHRDALVYLDLDHA